MTVSGPGGTGETSLPDGISVDPGPLAEVLVSPAQITLGAQDVTRLGATALDQFGNEIVIGVFTWDVQSPDGRIDEKGGLTAGTKAGNYKNLVTVTTTLEGITREAFIDVAIGPGPLASLVVEPSDVTLDIGSTELFTFTASDEFGNVITDALASWSLSPGVGAIDVDGVLTAGTFPASVQLNVVRGTVNISKTADALIRPDPLATIEVQPSFIVVEREATQQFTAVGLDQYGNEIPGLAFLWEATGGDIDQAGVFTADGFGSSEVTASAIFRDSAGAGSARVDVSGIYGGTFRAATLSDTTTFDPALALSVSD